jgi:soluble lytic murein transglycosylase
MAARAARTSQRRARSLAALVVATWATAALSEEPADDAPIPESQLEDLIDGGSGQQQATRRYGDADLAPYFGSGTLAEAKALFDRRRYARARAALRGEEPPVRYLRALAGLHTDPATAVTELSALAADYPAMRDHCLFHAARALERLRKRRAAAAAYAQVSPGSTLFADARLAQSRVLERALDLGAALEALTPLRALPATPRNDAVRRKALLAAARLCQKRGDYPGEHRAMLELWATSPHSREAEVVWTRLRELPIPNRWRLLRAESFLSFHDNAEAMRLALQVKTLLPDEHACRAAFVVGNALRKERQHRKAVAALAPMVDACRASELRPEAMYVLGYSQSIVARQDAVRTYDALAREYPEHPFADDALFFAAELDLRDGRSAAALERLQRVAVSYAAGNFAPEALFRLAWQHRAAGARDAALATLDRLGRLAGLGREQRLRARYWRARTLEEWDDASAAAELAALAAEHPASWYGLLARGRLVGDARAAVPSCAGSSACVEASIWPLEAGSMGTDPRFLAGVELLRMGLGGAEAELLAIDRRGLTEDAARLLMEALQRTGRERAAAYVARTTLGAGLTGGIDARTAEVWQATYPRPFRQQVERWAKASRIDADLLQALIREESLFNPWARSSTGAIGLTQLMPRTAREVAAGLRMRVTTAALHRPDLNIRLGAAYLGDLLAQLDGSRVLAVAAYNAGPEAVWRWIRARPDAEVDEWVEQIPAAETRNYVKHVLGSYGAYRLVYGGAPPPLEEKGGPVAAREPGR